MTTDAKKLMDAMQKVCDDGKKIAATCRTCGIKNMDVCRTRECDNLTEVLAQVVLVRALEKRGLVKARV